jgi:hypothetical protein
MVSPLLGAEVIAGTSPRIPHIVLLALQIPEYDSWKGIPQSVSHAETAAGLHVKCPLLSEPNQSLKYVDKF